jgi:hypothetical protein
MVLAYSRNAEVTIDKKSFVENRAFAIWANVQWLG